MTREELDEHIEYVSHIACGYPPISIMASEVERWLKDIRDNGITEPKKYTIKIFPSPFSYLNMTNNGSEATTSGLNEPGGWRLAFTKSEIEHLKQRDDLAIDWDKAIIEPVEDE